MPDDSKVVALEREVDRLARLIEELRLDHFRIHGLRVEPGKPADKEVLAWNSAENRFEYAAGAQVLLARATDHLILTTSDQSIIGDGNSNKVRLLLPTIGEWLVQTFVAFRREVTDPGNLIGSLYVDDGGSAETGIAIFRADGGESLDAASVAHSWKVTTTAENTPIELKAKMGTGSGNGSVRSASTVLLATIGVGGGGP